MAKLISYDFEARSTLKKGVDQLANAVKVTLGPLLKTALLSPKKSNLKMQ